ncbi:MAG: hypothetical protein LBS84_03235 [Clostridiales bacterium]|jgi:hypothetical protein|nr:hypothetical protein [Clostridiales bacterium]
MKDILLDAEGDLKISEWGDISLTDSVRQAVRIRLLWFFNEWRFAPQYGIPYYEEILVKNPNLERIKSIIKTEAMSVDEVSAVRNVAITWDKSSRNALVAFDIVIDERTYREEVLINV